MITVDKLDVVYGAKEKRNHVVRGVSLTVNKGETLGIVGESGCGKSTLLRSLAGLEAGWTGSISFNGKPVGKTRSRDELKLAQMVFQDPYGSLHPRHRIGRALAEPVRAMGLGDGWSKVPAALQQVGLPGHFAERFPHELSGGQRQRVAIERADPRTTDPAARRADIRARRFHPGRNPQPSCRPARRTRSDLCSRQPRSSGHRPYVRSRAGDAERRFCG